MTDFIIPNTTFLMFCLQMGITLPANSLKKFDVEYWGKDLDNPQLYFKSSEFEDKVGNFARCPVARGRKLGKLVFVFSEDAVAHSGKLWHCSGCGRGFPTIAFFSKHKEGEGCQLFESVLLIGRKKLGWGKSKVRESFPYGCPGSKAAKKSSFSPQKKLVKS